MRVTSVVLFAFLFLVVADAFLRVPLERKWTQHRTRNTKYANRTNQSKMDPEIQGHSDLFGNLAETRVYYATVHIGGQPFSVLIDTGSVSLAVPAANCHMYNNPTDSKAVGVCKTANEFYQTTSEAVYEACTSGCTICQDHNCWFSVSYTDDSYIRGPLITDDVELSGIVVPSMFGAIERESPNFSVGSCDGILGFAFPELDTTAGDCLFSNMVANGLIEKDIFSICLGEKAGELFLGGYDPDLDAGPIYYVDMLTPYDFYRVSLENIQIGPHSLDVPFVSYPTTIIDSGTTFIELADDIWDAFVQVFQTQYGELPHVDSSVNIFSGFCFTDINLRAYPSIFLTLGNDVVLEITPPQYMIPGISVTGEECRSLAVIPSGDDRTILGDAFMQSYNIIFDRVSHRIGFAHLQNCADIAFISGISAGDGITVTVGTPFQLKVEVQYLVSHSPVVGLIVEFVVSRGAAATKFSGVATDIHGIATLETYLTTNGTAIFTALVPGSLSPVLEFTVHATGELPPSFDDYSTFYSSWKVENTNFILGIPTWVILTIFGVILLVGILLTGLMATLAVRSCRNSRFGSPSDHVFSYGEEDDDEESEEEIEALLTTTSEECLVEIN